MNETNEQSFVPPEAIREVLKKWGNNAELMQLAAEGWKVTLPNVKLGVVMRSMRGVTIEIEGDLVSVKIPSIEAPYQFAVPLAAFSDERELAKWKADRQARAEANILAERAEAEARWKIGKVTLASAVVMGIWAGH